MSLFDPFQLYKREQKKTHTGQILIKKPPISIPGVLTEEEIAKATEMLSQLGYTLYPPGQFPQHVETYVQDVDIILNLGQINYNSNQTILAMDLATIWQNCHQQFNMPFIWEHVSDFQVLFAIKYVQIYYCTLSNGSYLLQFYVRQNDHYPFLAIGPSSSASLSNLGGSGFSISSFSDPSQVLVQASNLSSTSANNKFALVSRRSYFGDDDPTFLTSVLHQSSFMYNDLKNENYADLAGAYPNLFEWKFSGTIPSGGIAFAHHLFAITVRMKYSYISS